VRLVRSLNSLASLEPGRRVVSIGAFDGLHIGHQVIVERAAGIAADSGEALVMLSFEPTPAEFFARGKPPARLTCFRERFERVASMGVDELVCLRFQSINSMTHQQFVDRILIEGLSVSHVVVGHDFRYGSGRGGDLATLKEAGRAGDFAVSVVDAVFVDGERVSSTGIRRALAAGDLGKARHMLGRDYAMSGRVVHGLGLGLKLGFPTANINLKRRQAPVDGIFAVEVEGLGPRRLAGVASVGSRPTVGGTETLLEVHIFDFDARIYGAYITVRFKARLRAEEKFATLAEMQAQMRVDVEAAKAALAERIA
jgi:riboflavin kinase/FMN adenylyltransferase